MRQKLTLKDIAKIAGVSEMTASRALRNTTDVSKKTQARVKEAATNLGYVRNKIASSLASNNVDLVGVVIPSVKSYVFSEVLDGISEMLAPTKLRPVFGLTNYDLKTEEDVIIEMLSWRPSGLIIAGLEHSDNARKVLKNANTTIVEIMDIDNDPIQFCVGISHYEAGYEMARKILTKGHKNIGFLGTKMVLDYRAEKRFRGFKDCLKKHNISLMDQSLYTEGSSIEKGKKAAKEMLERSPDLHCIYCSTDVSAIGILMHCIETNIKVPEQLALAGFNNLSLAHGMPRKIATTDSMRYEIGRKAAQIIISQNQNTPDSQEKIVKLTPTVQPGNTL